MKKSNIVAILGICFPSFLIAEAVPVFVQVPSSFATTSIDTNTSRYFFQQIDFSYPGNESYVVSFYNSGNRVARISAIGCATHYSGASDSFSLNLYKNAQTYGTSYTSIANSTLAMSTNGNFVTGSDQVYMLQAAGNTSNVRGFEYIPKDLYSVVVAPGETITMTLTAYSSANYTAIVMWEEIVN